MRIFSLISTPDLYSNPSLYFISLLIRRKKPGHGDVREMTSYEGRWLLIMLSSNMLQVNVELLLMRLVHRVSICR